MNFTLYYQVKTLSDDIGPILVARFRPNKKISFVGFTDDVSILRKHFPSRNVVFEEDDADKFLTRIIEKVTSLWKKPKKLDEYLKTIDLDLSRSSDFQKKVYKQMRKIPPGKTMSYSELAKLVGKPNACRAVASACAVNRISLILPCHRVIGKSGKMRGFGWGVSKKKILLRKEGIKM